MRVLKAFIEIIADILGFLVYILLSPIIIARVISALLILGNAWSKKVIIRSSL
jgi:hypothetical protein